MKNVNIIALPLLVAFLAVAANPAFGQTATPLLQAVAPYTLSVFATAASGLSAPDSIAVRGKHVFVGYGDGHKPLRHRWFEQSNRGVSYGWQRRSYVYRRRPQ